jgi:cytidylate kinase
MNRADAPLKPADDAQLLDTTDLSIDAAIDRAAKLVAARLPR